MALGGAGRGEGRGVQALAGGTPVTWREVAPGRQRNLTFSPTQPVSGCPGSRFYSQHVEAIDRNTEIHSSQEKKMYE